MAPNVINRQLRCSWLKDLQKAFCASQMKLSQRAALRRSSKVHPPRFYVKHCWRWRKQNSFCGQTRVRINCAGKRRARATRKRRVRCKLANRSYLPVFGKAHEGGGNDGRMESSGKPNPGFPLLSTGLGNRSRDSHISTAPTIVTLVRKAKKKETSSAIASDRLKAHPWIGKHYA